MLNNSYRGSWNFKNLFYFIYVKQINLYNVMSKHGRYMGEDVTKLPMHKRIDKNGKVIHGYKYYAMEFKYIKILIFS